MASFQYNPANDATYKSILAGYQNQANYFNGQASAINNGYAQMLLDNKQVGESDRIALAQQYERQGAQSQQSMISRGLGNTNVLDSAQRGINYDQSLAQINLNDSLYRRQSDIQGQQLAHQSQAAQFQAGLGMQALGYQGDALAQRYNSEANYVTQHDIGEQQSKMGLNNQLQLGAVQQQYAMQNMLKQQQFQDSQQQKYGYY